MGSGGATGWLLQRLSGLGLALLLLIHFFLQHFAGHTTEVTYQTVAARLHQPWYKVMGLLLLLLAVWHGMYGLWQVVQDYVHTLWQRVLLYALLWILGTGAFIFGALTVITFK